MLALGNFDPAPLPGIAQQARTAGVYRHNAWAADTFDRLDPEAPVTCRERWSISELPHAAGKRYRAETHEEISGVSGALPGYLVTGDMFCEYNSVHTHPMVLGQHTSTFAAKSEPPARAGRKSTNHET